MQAKLSQLKPSSSNTRHGTVQYCWTAGTVPFRPSVHTLLRVTVTVHLTWHHNSGLCGTFYLSVWRTSVHRQR
jgi:hypothetical protein